MIPKPAFLLQRAHDGIHREKRWAFSGPDTENSVPREIWLTLIDTSPNEVQAPFVNRTGLGRIWRYIACYTPELPGSTERRMHSILHEEVLLSYDSGQEQASYSVVSSHYAWGVLLYRVWQSCEIPRRRGGTVIQAEGFPIGDFLMC
jgi:hypothetical protein